VDIVDWFTLPNFAKQNLGGLIRLSKISDIDIRGFFIYLFDNPFLINIILSYVYK